MSLTANEHCRLCAGKNRVQLYASNPEKHLSYWMDCPRCRPSSTSGVSTRPESLDLVEVKGKYKVHGTIAANNIQQEPVHTMFHETYESVRPAAEDMARSKSAMENGSGAVIYKAVEVIQIEFPPVAVKGVK